MRTRNTYKLDKNVDRELISVRKRLQELTNTVQSNLQTSIDEIELTPGATGPQGIPGPVRGVAVFVSATDPTTVEDITVEENDIWIQIQ